MTVDGVGKWCTFEERIIDLTIRHGKDSKDVIESLKIVEELQNSGKEVEKIVTGLLSFYRDVLMCKAGIYNDCEEKIIEFVDEDGEIQQRYWIELS